MDLRDLERRSGGGVAAAASPFSALRGGDGGEGARDKVLLSLNPLSLSRIKAVLLQLKYLAI